MELAKHNPTGFLATILDMLNEVAAKREKQRKLEPFKWKLKEEWLRGEAALDSAMHQAERNVRSIHQRLKELDHLQQTIEATEQLLKDGEYIKGQLMESPDTGTALKLLQQRRMLRELLPLLLQLKKWKCAMNDMRLGMESSDFDLAEQGLAILDSIEIGESSSTERDQLRAQLVAAIKASIKLQ